MDTPGTPHHPPGGWWPLYLGGIRSLEVIDADTALSVMLEATLRELCQLRDDCDDPWTCCLASTCPKGAKVRRWYKVPERQHVRIIE